MCPIPKPYPCHRFILPELPSATSCRFSISPNTLLFFTDQELEPQNWCCRFNDKPSFCALYELMRPRIGCSGYQPPRPGELLEPGSGTGQRQSIRGRVASQDLTKAAQASWGRAVATREDGDGSSVWRWQTRNFICGLGGGEVLGVGK